MRPFLLMAALLGAACRPHHPANTPPVRAPRDTARVTQRPPAVVRDTVLEQRAAASSSKCWSRKHRWTSCRAGSMMRGTKSCGRWRNCNHLRHGLSSVGHGRGRDRAAGAAFANGSNAPPSPEYGQGSQLLQLATAEFDQQNYAGALYLATEAKNAAAAGRGRVASDDRSATRRGEVPFVLPLRLQTTGRANVREGPGAGFKVLFTLRPACRSSPTRTWISGCGSGMTAIDPVGSTRR